MNGKPVGTFVICEAVDRLAHELAEAAAIVFIETEALAVSIAGQRWFDVSFNISRDMTVREEGSKEIEYLDARGLLRHHPDQPNLVQILKENDAAQEENSTH